MEPIRKRLFKLALAADGVEPKGLALPPGEAGDIVAGLGHQVAVKLLAAAAIGILATEAEYVKDDMVASDFDKQPMRLAFSVKVRAAVAFEFQGSPPPVVNHVIDAIELLVFFADTGDVGPFFHSLGRGFGNVLEDLAAFFDTESVDRL